MGEYLFVLSGECLALGKAEVERTINSKGKLKENKLLIETKELPELNLGCSKEASKIIFKSNNLELLIDTKNIDWNAVIVGSYSIEFEKGVVDSENRELFKNEIWNSLKKRKVNLKNPDTIIKIYSDIDELVITKKIWVNKEDFESRKAHLREFNHPTSLNPKLARTMINLAGPDKELIADLFCGSGGILIEAALMKKKVIGRDLDPIQIKRAKANLESLKLEVSLEEGDALEFCENVDAVISDLPYGKNSKVNNIDNLLTVFFDNIAHFTNTLVVGSERNMKLSRLFGEKWQVIGKFSIYVHKSMTKELFVLEKK